MVYLLKIVLFHSYVSLPEGIIIFWCNFGYTPCSNPNPLFIGSRLLNHIKPPFFKSPFLLVKFPHPFFGGVQPLLSLLHSSKQVALQLPIPAIGQAPFPQPQTWPPVNHDLLQTIMGDHPVTIGYPLVTVYSLPVCELEHHHLSVCSFRVWKILPDHNLPWLTTINHYCNGK